MKNLQRIRVMISGKVQGVYYRASVQVQAQGLAITGWVQNQADGSVLLEAQGDPEALASLVKWCHHGPPTAQVTGVEVTPLPVSEGETGFDFKR
ncbi:MAG: acylphosphatase [Bacteroidetes bacterium]|nr:acylphosphatase [Bacteroidota bacterium]